MAETGPVATRPAPTRARPPRPSAAPSTDSLVGGVICLAALIGGLSGAQPTGIAVWDSILTAGFAALVTAACSKAPRRSGLIFTTVAAALCGLSIWLFVGAATLLLAIGAAYLDRRDRVTAAIIGAGSVLTMLQWPPLGFFGLPSIIAGVACGYLFFEGYRHSRKRTRRMIRRVVIVVAVVTGVLLLLFGLALLSARTETNRGVDAARRGLSAVRSGDAEAVSRELTTAGEALRRADGQLGAFWIQPLRLMPVVGQHQHSLATAVEQGAVVADNARLAVEQANLADVSFANGAIDLATLRDAAPQLTATSESIDRAGRTIQGTYSPWLVTPVQDRVRSLLDELGEAAPEARLSAQAAEIVPGMLGADGPRRYLVMLTNPAESRELGGFVGSYALVEFNAGQLSRIESGRVLDLYERARAGELDHPAGYPDNFLANWPSFWPQNLTGMPEMFDVNRAVQDLFPELAGAPIAGTIIVDPHATAALLKLTGPVHIADLDTPITADNAVDFLFREQYVVFPDPADRFVALAAILDAALDALNAASLPGPEQLGAELGPAARSGRLQMATADPAINDFLRTVHLLRDFGVRRAGQDFLAVTHSNGASNKMDIYLDRNVNYRATVDSGGNLTGTVQVTLRSDVPANAPAYTLGLGDEIVVPGENRIILSVYTPHELTEVRRDGQAKTASRHLEQDMWRYIETVVLAPGESATVEFDLQSAQPLAPPYELRLWQQPLVNTDGMQVQVANDAGALATGPFDVEQSVTIDAQGNVEFD